MEFSTIKQFIATIPTEQDCIIYLEEIRWAGNVVSPFDISSKVYKCASGKYKCKNTGKYFNVRIGTIFQDTKIPLTDWFMALYIFASHKKGISSYQLAKDIGVTQGTAWFMLHRLRKMFTLPQNQEKLKDVVEADCTFIGGKTSFKHKSKREEDNARGTGAINKTPVFGMIERNGELRTTIVKAEDKINIHPIIKSNIDTSTTLVTDGHGAYKGLNEYNHQFLEHEKGEFARNHFHTGNIDCFWSQLKRGIKGLYHNITPKHTNAYAQEFTLRYNTRKLSINSRFDYILTNMENRLTYKELTA